MSFTRGLIKTSVGAAAFYVVVMRNLPTIAQWYNDRYIDRMQQRQLLKSLAQAMRAQLQWMMMSVELATISDRMPKIFKDSTIARQWACSKTSAGAAADPVHDSAATEDQLAEEALRLLEATDLLTNDVADLWGTQGEGEKVLEELEELL
eukprot:gene12313-12449_t